MSESRPPVHITGGAGPEEAAAITAVIAQLMAEEAAAMASPAQRPRQSSWVLAWRPQPNVTPLPSHTYNSMPWSELEAPEELES